MDKTLFQMRNKIVHGGVNANAADAKEAVDAAIEAFAWLRGVGSAAPRDQS